MKQERRPKIASKIILFLVILCIISVITQVLWPGKKFMFATKVGGVNVTGLTRAEARAKVEEIFIDHVLRIETTDGVPITSVDVPLEQIAIDAMMNDELEYPLWQRLIPFSSFARVFYSNWIGAEVNLNIDEIMISVHVAPTDAHVSSVDGQLTVSSARNGFTIDREALASRLSIIRLASSGETILRIPAEVLPYNTDDTKITSQAERAPATHTSLLETFRGKEFSISAAALDGHWDLSLSQDKIWTSASTYKLYLAYYMLKKVDSGELSWGNIESCFNRMIVNSDNACPESWLVKYGFGNINTAIHDIGGLSHTKIADGNMQTSARDLATFLQKLYKFEILSESSTNHLLAAMKRQTYRDGIPAGVTAATVADKVGFMWSLLHDAAIVFSEDGDFVLVVMTDGSSWSNIASLASIISSFNEK